MELENKIEEARRYVSNAKDLLREKAIKSGNFYQDSKYVKLAGHSLWTGCLIALEYALDINKTKGRLDIKDYLQAVAKRDKKLLTLVNDGYMIMHLHMGYDGVKNYSVCKSGIEDANAIIDWCEANR